MYESSLAAADMASQLIDIFGGTEQFITQTSFYYSEFYSEAERVATTTRQLSTIMGELGFALPQTREQFRQLVEAQDLTTEAGRRMFAALIGLAPAFNSVASAAASAMAAISQERANLQRQLLGLQGNTAELRRLELEALDPSNRELQERIWKLEEEKEAQQLAAQAAAAAASARQQQVRQDQESAKRIKETWASITDSIIEEILRIRGIISATPGQTVETAFVLATARARAGDQEASKLLPSLSRDLLEFAQQTAASSLDLRRIQSSVASSLQETATILAKSFGLSIPQFQTGTNYVPYDTLAMIHKGEAIVPKQYNPAAGGQDMASELKEIRRELVELKNHTAKVSENTLNSYKQLDRWDVDGLGTYTVTAP
jgi:hypothetical protein